MAIKHVIVINANNIALAFYIQWRIFLPKKKKKKRKKKSMAYAYGLMIKEKLVNIIESNSLNLF